MALSHGISEEIVAQGQAILDIKSKSVGEVKDEFLDFLKSIKMLEMQTVHSSKTLTHPKKRGSLMVNPNNAHRNGSLIRRVGANLRELHMAVAVEMSPDQRKRQEIYHYTVCV